MLIYVMELSLYNARGKERWIFPIEFKETFIEKTYLNLEKAYIILESELLIKNCNQNNMLLIAIFLTQYIYIYSGQYVVAFRILKLYL